MLLCIGTGKKVQDQERFRFDTQEFYLKSAEEMARLFPDHPEALSNTVRIAEMCDFTLAGGLEPARLRRARRASPSRATSRR